MMDVLTPQCLHALAVTILGDSVRVLITIFLVLLVKSVRDVTRPNVLCNEAKIESIAIAG
jgi:hypothetical protein